MQDFLQVLEIARNRQEWVTLFVIVDKYRVGQKTGPVWALITQRWLVLEKYVIRQKFQNAVKNKRQICIVKHLNILCLICINLHYPWNRHLPGLSCARVHWTQELTAKKSRFKFCELFSVGALQQIASSQNFSNWPAKTCANRMLGSADLEHIDYGDWSAA